MEIKVGDERLEVRESSRGDGGYQYDFTWLNGPQDGSYGFAIGGGMMTHEALQQAADGFIGSFFEPDGVGPSDFPDFIASRKSSET